MRRTVLLFVLMVVLGIVAPQRNEAQDMSVCERQPPDGFVFVPVDVGDGRMVQALVDTGATTTIMASCAVEQFAEKQKTGETTRIMLADGKVEEAEDWILTFQVGPIAIVRHRVLVFKEMSVPMIVGLDVLQITNAVIVPRGRRVVFLPEDTTLPGTE